MKTRKTLMLALLVSFLGTVGCAAVSPPIVEHEEELTSMEGLTPAEKKAEGKLEPFRWSDYATEMD